MAAAVKSEHPAPSEIEVGVSACLVGRNVRYDGGHKRDRFVTEELARFVTLVPICPEVDIGLGTPREAIRLVDGGGGVELLGRKSGDDHTAAMRRYAGRRAAELRRRGLCGYIFKSKSPSCGVHRLPIYGAAGHPVRRGRGLFAAAVIDELPELPVEEEGRLNDTGLRQSFVTRVFARARLRRALAPGWRMRDLVALHASEKLLLLAHSPAGYRALGRLVAGGKALEPAALAARYRREFMEALAAPPTIGRHVDVLQHIAGYFRGRLDAAARRDVAAIIDEYGRGRVSLVAPITLLAFFARRFEVEYLLAQSYLSPYPEELVPRDSDRP